MTKRYILPEAKEFAKRFGGISKHGIVHDVPGAALGSIDVDDYNAIREATAVEDEAQRLVGKARGEPEDWNASTEQGWADAGGGEEKPVRTPDPATDTPCCGRCAFWKVYNSGMGECRRFPSKVTKAAGDLCGEFKTVWSVRL